MDNFIAGKTAIPSISRSLKALIAATIVLLLLVSFSEIFSSDGFSSTSVLFSDSVRKPKYDADGYLKTFLDRKYQPKRDFDIVVSYYRENVTELKSFMDRMAALPVLKGLNPHVILYVKDPKTDVAMIRELESLVGAEVHHLDNKGREGETFLRHIVDHWDDLATHTFFTQAVPQNEDQLRDQIQASFLPSKTGMMGLGFKAVTCPCLTCHDNWWIDDLDLMPRIYEQTTGQKCTEATRVRLSYKSQFIVSAARIRGAKKAVYAGLHEMLSAGMDHASHIEVADKNHADADSLNSPFAGFTIERIWNVLMQCSEDQHAKSCPTMEFEPKLERRQIYDPAPPAPGVDCQCLDS